MKLLVTPNLEATEEDLALLREAGAEITFHADEHVLPEHPEMFEGAICNSLFHYHDIKQFSKLRYIQLCSVGLDRVPLPYIAERGITLHNAGGVYAIPMAEWTVMRAMELIKKVPEFNRRQQEGRWKKVRGIGELAGKTALIVGLGDYGRETAKRLSALGMRVVAVNRSMKEYPFIESCHALSELKALLPQADLLILAVAITPQTRQLIGANELAAMKDGAFLLNMARGGLVDEAALIKALQAGKLGGAALDVFETEPLPEDSPLWKLPNVLLSAHNSFIGERDHERMMELVVRNLKAFLN